LIAQNLQQAEETTGSQRDEHLAAAIQSLAQLPLLAIARWRKELSRLGIDRETLNEMLKAERARQVLPTPASEEIARRAEPTKRARYMEVGRAFHTVEQSRDGGTYTRPLCNFTARIVEDVARDDGQDVSRQLVITGQLSTGHKLPQCRVSSTTFPGMAWVMDHWGVKAVVNAGQATKDKLREAIQLASHDAPSRTVYTHTGWREIDGKRIYLTAGGALGIPNVEVELDGPLARYVLPVDLEDANPRKAMTTSLRLLAVAPWSVTFSLWGAMYLAPLSEILYPNFVLWLYGQSGSLKSTLAALFLSHYGDFTYKTLPEGWISSDNILEKQTFLVKDAPLIIDDFAPQNSGIDAQGLERKAARIVRAVGNQSGRNRMNADTSTRMGYRPRGLDISTGEQLPSGESIMARTFPVEVKREIVDLDRLTKAQNEQGLLPQGMAGYILWLSEQWETLKGELPQRHRDLRDELRGKSAHLRTPEMFASILLGNQMGLTYAQIVGALTPDKAAAYFERAKETLRALAEMQAEHVRDERPSTRYLSIIRELIAQGKVNLMPLDGEAVEGKGDLLGWCDADFVYLPSDAAYHAVAKFCRDEGGTFPLKPKSLHRMLESEGILVPGTQKDRLTVMTKGQRTIRLGRKSAQL